MATKEQAARAAELRKLQRRSSTQRHDCADYEIWPSGSCSGCGQPSKASCAKRPVNGDGSGHCVLRRGHKGFHKSQDGAAFRRGAK